MNNILDKIASLNGKTVEPEKVDYGKLLQDRIFDFCNPPKNVDFCFSVNVDTRDYKVGGFGMLGMITGLAKSRKTTFLIALIASALDGGNKYINMKMDIGDKKAVFIDTEQPQYYFWNTQKKIHLLSGHISAAPNYKAYSMRDLDRFQRIAAIEHLIETNENLGLIIIDGALDLVANFNSETECMEVVQKFMNWTEKSGAMVITVIHKNASSFKAMGHLGSMLEKKCDFAIEMQYNDETRFTTVKHSLARSAPFNNFEFTQDSNGYPILDHNQKVILPVEENGYFPTIDPFSMPFQPSNVITRPKHMNGEDVPF